MRDLAEEWANQTRFSHEHQSSLIPGPWAVRWYRWGFFTWVNACCIELHSTVVTASRRYDDAVWDVISSWARREYSSNPEQTKGTLRHYLKWKNYYSMHLSKEFLYGQCNSDQSQEKKIEYFNQFLPKYLIKRADIFQRINCMLGVTKDLHQLKPRHRPG